MTEEQKKKLDSFVSKLDTAVGMMLVASSSSKEVKEAVEIVSDVSFEISKLIDD